MKLYVINLPDAVERRASITRQLTEAGLDYELVRAVDGRKMSEAERRALADTQRFDAWHELRSPGAMGCALSHRSVYERMLRDGCDAAIVIEDDAFLSRDFASAIPVLEAELREDEIILLFLQSNWHVHLTSAGAVGLSGNSRLLTLDEFTYFGGAVGYVIPAAVARRMVHLQTPVASTADDWARFHKLGAVRHFRLALPFLVTSAGFTSNIGYGNASRARRLARRVERLRPAGAIMRWARRTYGKRRERIVID